MQAVRPGTRKRSVRSHDRCDKRVAATPHGRDVTVSHLAVAKRPPQRRDMHLEITVLDYDAGPYPRDQLSLADELAWTLQQGYQDVESATAEPDRPVLFE